MRVVKGVLENSLAAIELMANHASWMRLSEIATLLELQKGPTHRMLALLVEQGWVEQQESTSQYRLTLKLPLLGQKYLQGTGLPNLVQPILDGVAAQCKELVRLTIVHGYTLSWFASSQGAAPGLMYQPAVASTIALHATANGKAWLATFDNDTAKRLALDGGMGKAGNASPKALTTVKALLSELELTRKRGYALSVEEAELGVVAMAMVIRTTPSSTPVGTMSIAGPQMRIPPARYEEFATLLRNAAHQVGSIWPREMAL